MKSKKILFTSHTANFSKFNRPFMRWFSEQGHEVHYASAGEEEVLGCDKHFTIPFERNPFKINNILAYKKLKKIIDTEKYDIIHTHTPVGSVITRLAARDARKNGTRVIYTAHGFHFYKGAPILNWLVYYPIEKFMVKYTDTLITINKEDYERAKNKFKTDVEYIPGIGIDLTKFKAISPSEKRKIRKQYGYSQDDYILISVAELNKNKNQGFLISQIKLVSNDIPNVKLLLCGEGDLRDKYNKQINRLRMGDKITLLGYRNDINRLLQISDICVASSIREGLGLSLLESMATNLPIIASDNRGHRDILNKQLRIYTFNVNNAEKFKLYVLNQYNNRKQENQEYYKNTPNQHLDRYSLKNAINNMEIIYDTASKKRLA